MEAHNNGFIFLVHVNFINVKMPTIVGILTSIGGMTTTFESLMNVAAY